MSVRAQRWARRVLPGVAIVIVLGAVLGPGSPVGVGHLWYRAPGARVTCDSRELTSAALYRAYDGMLLVTLPGPPAAAGNYAFRPGVREVCFTGWDVAGGAAFAFVLRDRAEFFEVNTVKFGHDPQSVTGFHRFEFTDIAGRRVLVRW